MAPQRIISLVPSQTELLYHLGLGSRVVGITKFCVHPQQWFKSKTRVGGTKKLHLNVIAQLQPDLILANKEENEQQQIEALQKEYNVHVTEIYHLPDALAMIQEVGRLTGTEQKAETMAQEIARNFSQLVPLQKPQSPKVAYLIWQKPYMVAAGHTFINDMLLRCGLQNAFGHLQRYPEVTAEQLQQAQPDYIFLSSEPFPFKEKHVQQFREICPEATIQVVDGEMFSWYGSRLLQATGYFKKLLATL